MRKVVRLWCHKGWSGTVFESRHKGGKGVSCAHSDHLLSAYYVVLYTHCLIKRIQEKAEMARTKLLQ